MASCESDPILLAKNARVLECKKEYNDALKLYFLAAKCFYQTDDFKASLQHLQKIISLVASNEIVNSDHWLKRAHKQIAKVLLHQHQKISSVSNLFSAFESISLCLSLALSKNVLKSLLDGVCSKTARDFQESLSTAEGCSILLEGNEISQICCLIHDIVSAILELLHVRHHVKWSDLFSYMHSLAKEAAPNTRKQTLASPKAKIETKADDIRSFLVSQTSSPNSKTWILAISISEAKSVRDNTIGSDLYLQQLRLGFAYSLMAEYIRFQNQRDDYLLEDVQDYSVVLENNGIYFISSALRQRISFFESIDKPGQTSTSNSETTSLRPFPVSMFLYVWSKAMKKRDLILMQSLLDDFPRHFSTTNDKRGYVCAEISKAMILQDHDYLVTHEMKLRRTFDFANPPILPFEDISFLSVLS